MQSSETESTEIDEKAAPFVEGVDFYFDEGLMVLTAHYLLSRGFCCGNNCKHCPYEGHEKLVLE